MRLHIKTRLCHNAMMRVVKSCLLFYTSFAFIFYKYTPKIKFICTFVVLVR